MKLTKYTCRVEPAQDGKRLDQVLVELLPPLMKKNLSKGEIRKWIMAGAVYLNRSRVKIAAKTMVQGAQLEVFVARVQGKKTWEEFQLQAHQILFEDDDLLVIDKPTGLPTQPTLDEARWNLYQAVKEFLRQRAGVALSQIYLGLHHRLDVDTSGVILFTKTTRVNRAVGELFAQHNIEKTYHCLVVAPLGGIAQKQPWQVRNFLGKVQLPGGQAGTKRGVSSTQANRFGAVRSGGLLAVTDFRLLGQSTPPLLLPPHQSSGTGRQFAWIEAKPQTGRTHQIRVHLSESGLPIVGDLKYGAPPLIFGRQASPRVMLHARRLSWVHPVSAAPMTVESPWPEDFQQFAQQVGVTLTT